jgi:hypothetical protein
VPLCRLIVFGGMPPGPTGCYIKVHHAVLDGQAGVLLAHARFRARRAGAGQAQHLR